MEFITKIIEYKVANNMYMTYSKKGVHILSRKIIVKEAQMALNQFKEEIANELGLSLEEHSLSALSTSREAGKLGGKLGGTMTKKLIINAYKNMFSQDNGI